MIILNFLAVVFLIHSVFFYKTDKIPAFWFRMSVFFQILTLLLIAANTAIVLGWLFLLL